MLETVSAREIPIMVVAALAIPAVAWDGFALNYWHGLKVPDDFFTWNIERALSERNVAVSTTGAPLPQEHELRELLVVLRAIATPGHATAHHAYLVTDHTRSEDPWLVLTGDALHAFAFELLAKVIPFLSFEDRP